MRRFFQLHLLTLVLLTIAAGILLGLNVQTILEPEVRVRTNSGRWSSYACSLSGSGQSRHGIETTVSLHHVYWPRRGWPYNFNDTLLEFKEDIEVPTGLTFSSKEWPFPISEKFLDESTISEDTLRTAAPHLMNRIYEPMPPKVYQLPDSPNSAAVACNIGVGLAILFATALTSECCLRYRTHS